MRRIARRFGIAGLSAALIAGALTSTQAGVIPWMYDAIFGPNYYGYGASAAYSAGPVSYSAGYSPCGPSGCGVPYAASSSCGPCNTGTCSSRVSYCGPCEVGCNSSTCSPKTTWKSEKPTVASPQKAEVKTQIRTNLDEPTLDNPAPRRPRTDDPNFDSNVELKKQVIESDPISVQPAGSSATGETNGFVPTSKLPAANEAFPAPKSVPEAGSKKPAPTFGSDLDGQANRSLNLDNKATWSLTSKLPQRSAARQTRFHDARIARRASDVKADPAAVATGTSVVRK